jgi:phenylalanine-4-hydroxylase
MLQPIESPPPGVAEDWTLPQDWQRFTPEQHAVWDMLCERQAAGLVDHAAEAFLHGLSILQLSGNGIPRLADLNEQLGAATGWQLVAVPGVIPNHAFFRHLAARRFPVARNLRSLDNLAYSEEPDMFHDIFGHVPMLTDPVFADFMQAWAQAGLRAEGLGASDFLGRLYLHTVEFGLVAEGGRLRAYGAGLLSSLAETTHAVTSPDARRIRLDIARVMRTEYHFDRFQETYFVVDSFDELLRVTAETEFASVYSALRSLPLLKSGEAIADDVVYHAD